MKDPTVAEARSLEDCIDAIVHLAREGRAGGAGGLRPETALEAIAVLAASLSALRGRALALGLESLPAGEIDLEAHLKDVRKRFMQEALDCCDGVQTKAAEILGMSFRSFRHYAKKHGLKSDEKGPGPAPGSARPV